jgi:FkbM family methyltransferase
MGLLRTFVERLSRGRVLKRHLPAKFGSVPILVSPDASLQFWKPRLESDLFEFAYEFVRNGSVVWDVGANVGLFAAAAAQCAGVPGKVIAVEADIWLASLLSRTAAIQPTSCARIQVISAAVSDASGIATFNIAKRGRASNFLSAAGGATETGGVRETISVVTFTLDWLFQQELAPDVLKIDVEGGESMVLKGAKRVLAEARPLILIEVLNRSRDEVTEMLLANRYTLFDWESKPRAKVSRACFNTLAIPLDK